MLRELSIRAHLGHLTPHRLGFVAAAILILAVPAVAQDVMRVEEDWKIVLNEPDDGNYSPQFHTVMSPLPTLDVFYSQVTWNYKDEGGYEAGGLQFQNWAGGELARARNFRTEALSTAAETITWTQRLTINYNTIQFAVVHGESTTWGSFGNYLMDANTGVQNLNDYDTNTSVVNSWITYGSNRVDSLTIVEVRKYDVDNNLLSVDTTPKVVFELEDQAEEAEAE
jgi:hypothetical protein